MPFRTVKFPCGTLRLGSGSWAQPGLAFPGLPDRLDLRGRWGYRARRVRPEVQAPLERMAHRGHREFRASKEIPALPAHRDRKESKGFRDRPGMMGYKARLVLAFLWAGRLDKSSRRRGAKTTLRVG